MAWEYMVKTIGYLKLESELNMFGEMGWEVCFMVEAEPGTSVLVVFKQEKSG